jgi:hypothetical protein
VIDEVKPGEKQHDEGNQAALELQIWMQKRFDKQYRVIPILKS